MRAISELGLKQEASSENPLVRIVEQKIQDAGHPIPFDQYMSAWVYGETGNDGQRVDGYYTGDAVKIAPFDQPGAFRTPPEHTPLYGLFFAKQILEMWTNLGSPEDFTIVEMGAGNGTLGRDILRGLRQIQKNGAGNIFDASRYVIIEIGKSLIARQKKTLEGFEDKVDIIRASASGNVPLKGRINNGVVISTELPDAFPVKMVRKEGDQWQELHIGMGDGEKFEEVWTPLTPEAQSYVNEYRPAVWEGRPYPINLASIDLMSEISRLLNRGYAVTVDYNCWTDRPLRLYANAGVIDDKRDEENFLRKKYFGKTDITTGIDFQAFYDAGKRKGLQLEGHVNQQGFLYGLGYDMELKKGYMANTPISEELYNPNDAGYDLGIKVEDITNNQFARELYVCTGWDVLIQSKGVESQERLMGARFIHDFNGEGNRSFHTINP